MMKINQARHEGAIVLKLAGPLSVGRNVRMLRRAVGLALAEEGRGLVLDLSAVGYLDAAGIGALISSHRRALRAGQRVVLTGLHRHVREILGVTQLAGQLGEATDEEQALRVLSRLEGRRDILPHSATPHLA
jgi:anti-sigma B factor antagonist